MKLSIAKLKYDKEGIEFVTNSVPLMSELFEYLTMGDMEFESSGKNGLMTFKLDARYVNSSAVCFLNFLSQRHDQKGVQNESVYCCA